ncbi:MAG: BlaI/MecI/CopY family transcriptional regulator [Clostridium sp.]|nr:BlaI/MecI/CopY family transcriptional regulator [Clostridium sp.]
MSGKSMILQQSEWIIMEKLWEESPKTIMQLYHALKENPGWSKSTVNTLLGRMVDKGILYYREGKKAKQYFPNVNREDAALAETESLLDRVYRGSVSMMMNTLVKRKDFSKEEIKELYEILKGLEEEQDG